MQIDEEVEHSVKGIKRASVDIEFRNLRYNVGKKPILKSISGKFSSGQLTGILGSSGAGKTTLLDILAGHTQSGVSGDVYVNGLPRAMRRFHKIARYIRQEDLIQPLLTVHESIRIAADLKLGRNFSSEDKQSVISTILSVIGLEASLDTKVECLSGGQRKRLIIALELVNNPAIIFLDEPTTGLDDVSMKNCVQFLKSLTLQGRTIVCTIHQPSDSLFKLFDTVYFMSDGFCIYNGTVPNLVPFLSNGGFSCPTNYNPADYIIEIVHDQKTNTVVFKDLANNGHVKSTSENSYRRDVVDGDAPLSDDSGEFATSFWTQFSILLCRNFLQLRRSRIALALHLGHNILCGLSVGILFYQVGAKSDSMMVNMKYLFGIVVYFLFTHAVAPILLYPPEVKLMEREYFNRWYSLRAYFAAFTLILLPVIVITTIIFVILTYVLSGQPLEWYRFVWFCGICILLAATAQGVGYTIGALFSPTRGTCIGSAIMIVLVLLSMQGIGYGDTLEPYMKRLMLLSFPYHAYAGITTSVLLDRGRIECDGIFCYFNDSHFTLLKMGFADTHYSHAATALFLFFVLHRIISYLLLKMRVAPGCAWFRNVKLFDLS